MPINVTCDCGKAFKVKDEAAAKRVKCPGCGSILTVPADHDDFEKHPAELQGIRSINSDVETTIQFVNESEQTIKVYWLNFEGKREGGTILKPGECHEGTTYLTHPFLIADQDDNAWYVYFPDAQPRTVAIVAPNKK